MFAIVLVLVQAPSAPDLAAVDRLPLKRSVALVLNGHDHGRIEAVVRGEAGQPRQPGEAVREYVEAAVALPQGCRRRRWRAHFMMTRWDGSVPYWQERGDAVLRHVSPLTEVALANDGKCPTGQYLPIASDIDPETVLIALSQLGDVRAGRRTVELSCTDAEGTGLCVDQTATLRAIASLTVTFAGRRDHAVAFQLTGKSRYITDVIIDPSVPNRIVISQRLYPTV